MLAEIVRCDLCKQEIQRLVGGNAMVMPGDSFQSWNKMHICRACCSFLNKAEQLNLIELDKTPLLEDAGFTKGETKDGVTAWTAPSFMKMYGGEFL